MRNPQQTHFGMTLIVEGSNSFPAGSYLFWVDRGNNIIMCKICFMWTSMICFWRSYRWLWTDFTHCSGIFIVDFEHANPNWVKTKLNLNLTVDTRCRIFMPTLPEKRLCFSVLPVSMIVLKAILFFLKAIVSSILSKNVRKKVKI